MGGHGGLNILFQKRWNVYNFDNREKIRQDEEAAAKEEHLKREQSRKRDAELRLEKLRRARRTAPSAHATTSSVELELKSESKSDSNHINFFEGIKIFDPFRGGIEGEVEKKDGNKKMKLMKKEKEPKVVMPEDDKYRLGYGVAGKGVKLPWYLASDNEDVKSSGNHSDDDGKFRVGKEGVNSIGKKTLQELREERLKREKRERTRTRTGVGTREEPERWRIFF